MKNQTIKLYQFVDFPIDVFVREYLYEVTPHDVLVDVTIDGEIKTKKSNPRRGARTPAIIVDKCRYLQDVIIRRGLSINESRTFTLNAEVLRSVIGKEYKPLLEVFVKMGYIRRGFDDGKEHYLYYEIGKASNAFTLLRTDYYLTDPFINFRIKKYKEKGAALLDSKRREYISQCLSDKGGEDFVRHYNKSLNYITIADQRNYKRYVDRRVRKNPLNELYYQRLEESLRSPKKEIFRVDQSHRIYHVLTSCKKEIVERYLSIDYSLDCHNSHPLLFCVYIISKHNISYDSSYIISSHLVSKHSSINNNINNTNGENTPFHNVGQLLRKELRDNNVEIESVERLTDDELEYIYLTSNGELWDQMNRLFPWVRRKQLKEEMFKAVFYSKVPDPGRYNQFARAFQQRFPNVYKQIGAWKKDKNKQLISRYMKNLHLPDDKGPAALSIAMMEMESDIFIEILRRIYDHGWHAINLHDCIIVPQTQLKKHPTKAQIQKIMGDVYREYGLCPTFK